MDTAVTTPPPESAPATPAPAPADPFAIDESALVSLSPEQRAGLEPVLQRWKETAKGEIEKRTKESEESFKPIREQADALQQLVRQPAFVAWWNQQQKIMSEGQPAATRDAVAAAKPQDFATPEEWSQAVLEASQGSPEKLQSIQSRMFSTMATPVVQQLQAQHRELSTQLEMKNLMEEHPDYKDLDQIGLDAKGQGTSLLEHCLNWAEANNKPLEEGYVMARRWADSMRSTAKSEAMGIVKEKKESVTEGPSTATSNSQVILVESLDEAMKRTMEDQLAGINKGVRYEVRPKSK